MKQLEEALEQAASGKLSELSTKKRDYKPVETAISGDHIK